MHMQTQDIHGTIMKLKCAVRRKGRKEEEEVRALKSQIAHLEKAEKRRNKKRDLLEKEEHAHPDSGSSDTRRRSREAIRDLETEDDLTSFNDMSISEVEEMISLSPHKEVITDELHKHKSTQKKLHHNQPPSWSTVADSDGGEAQAGSSSDNSDAEAD